MIKLLTQKNSIGLTLSGLIYAYYVYILPDLSAQKIGLIILLYLEGVILNYFCYRFAILGRKTALPTLLFSLFSALFVVDLSLETPIYGAIFLSALYLSFRAKEIPNCAINHLIYMGFIMGVSQAFYNQSILFFGSVLILFIQVGIVSLRGFIMSLANLGMVIASAIGLYIFMDSPERIIAMIPKFTSSNSPSEIVLLKITSPIILLTILFHLLMLSSYSFRFPNLSKNINYTFLAQLILGIITVLVSSNQGVIIYAVMALAILLSFTFVYLKKSVFANALFTALLIIILTSLYICRIIFL